MAIPYKKQFVKSDGRKLTRSGPRDMQNRVTGGGNSTDLNLVELLTNQITDLKADVLAMKSRSGDAPPTGFFSPEQVDDEIRKAVESAVAETTLSLKASGNKESDLLPLVKEYKSQILGLQQGHDNLTRLHAAIIKENTGLKESISKLKVELEDVNELRKQIAVLEQELDGKKELIETLKTRPAIVNGEVITDPDRPQIEQVFVDPLEDDAGDGLESSITIDTVTAKEAVGDKVDKLRDLLGKLPIK